MGEGAHIAARVGDGDAQGVAHHAAAGQGDLDLNAVAQLSSGDAACGLCNRQRRGWCRGGGAVWVLTRGLSIQPERHGRAGRAQVAGHITDQSVQAVPAVGAQ